MITKSIRIGFYDLVVKQQRKKTCTMTFSNKKKTWPLQIDYKLDIERKDRDYTSNIIQGMFKSFTYKCND